MLSVPKRLRPELYRPDLERKACRRVTLEDASVLPELVAKMAAHCAAHNGCALAAPQVGIYIQLAVVIDPESNGPLAPWQLTLVNPVITNLGGRDILDHEGCLSLPPPMEATAKVWRSETVTFTNGTVRNPDANEEHIYHRWLARIVQHEIDHLHPAGGIFFINRIGFPARERVLRMYEQEKSRRDG